MGDIHHLSGLYNEDGVRPVMVVLSVNYGDTVARRHPSNLVEIVTLRLCRHFAIVTQYILQIVQCKPHLLVLRKQTICFYLIAIQLLLHLSEL